jgi:hypothetical protein
VSGPPLQLLFLLASRLERLSADSRWAHRASGLRGNILKIIEETGTGDVSPERVNHLIDRGFLILEAAAREIPGTER